MPQLKTKAPSNSQKASSATAVVIQHPTLTDACDLISIMLDYEASTRSKAIDLSTSRFAMLTASERQMLRAELIADYIHLSASNQDKAPDTFNTALETFANKVCDMKIPSHELIGTYLAAIDVVTKDKTMSHIPGLIESVRRTMIKAMQGCVELMRVKAEG